MKDLSKVLQQRFKRLNTTCKKVSVPFIDRCLHPELMEMGWNGEHIQNELEHFYFDTERRCLLESEKHFID